MELEQLRQLDVIAREGTMTAAACALHLSQPALSRSVQRLEAELATPLFSRAGRGVTLTDAGRAEAERTREERTRAVARYLSELGDEDAGHLIRIVRRSRDILSDHAAREGVKR